MTNLPQQFSLKHKNVLITGATGYLGQAMAIGLAELGATVIINGRNREKVEALVEALSDANFSAFAAAFDINNEDAVRDWFHRHNDLPIHGLVNNAYAGGSGSIETAVTGDYQNSFEVSIVSSHRMLHHSLPNLRLAVKECGQASIVNIGSMYGVVSPDHRIYADKSVANPPFYGAAKAALIHWTRYAACEFGSEGIRVNAISPGPFPSKKVQSSNPDFVAILAGKVPLGRVGKAEELQGPLSFLISDASSFVNGANLMVDGGWTCW